MILELINKSLSSGFELNIFTFENCQDYDKSQWTA